MNNLDVSIRDHGSVVQLIPLTAEGRDWLFVHMPGDCPRWGRDYVVEPRFLHDIVIGATDDGIEIAHE
jgi:hypothetical protein